MRNYGRFTTSIYRDDDFRSLTATQQAVYFMLGLQAEVTAAGTLPLTLRRWAANFAEMTVAALRGELAVLETAGHILIDEDTEELLIVKFVKWDGGIGNEKRRPVIEEMACAIASLPIRHRMAYELTKLGQSDMASKLTKDALSDTQSRFDRVVVTEGDELPQPLTATPEREPSASDDAEPLSPFCSKHPNGTETPCGPCATARTRYAAHVKATVEQEAIEKAERRAAIEACEACDDFGRRLSADHGRIIGPCDHRRSA